MAKIRPVKKFQNPIDSKEDKRILQKNVPMYIQETVLLRQMQPLNGTSLRSSLMAQASQNCTFCSFPGEPGPHMPPEGGLKNQIDKLKQCDII